MAQDRKAGDWCLPKRVAYVVDHSFPYTSDGYAVRTHAVARALTEAGHDIIVMNRPGRPWDIEGFDPDKTIAAEQRVDGVRYVFLPAQSTPGMNRRARLRQAEKVLLEAFGIYRPGAVLAVSNWENAEPAQYAARRWQVPFFYEQRGFWEMTRAASEPGYEDTEDYAQNRANELRIAEGARAVFTLNRAMRDELERRGVAPGKIHLVPNGIATPGRIDKGITRQSLGISSKYLLGYVGSLSEYEGSSDLIPLLARLRAKDIDADLVIVGSSAPKGLIGSDQATPTEARLQREAAEQGLAGHVHFVPQVPQDRVGAYYGLLDAVIIPRRRTIVTELVAPLKPYAAAAYGVPVFMTDMPPLDEIAEDIHASLFPEGDMATLADMLAETLTRGGHPAVMNTVKPAIHWSRRILPISRALTAAAQAHPSPAAALNMMPPAKQALAMDGDARSGDSGFDTYVLPRVALYLADAEERIVGVGPCAHLNGDRLTRATRVSLLSDLATGAVGRFVIDWLGLQNISGPQDSGGEWAGLWSIDNMRLNRQIMDACRIARDRGWRIEVTGPVARSRAPLFRTVAGVVEEVDPVGAETDREAAQ